MAQSSLSVVALGLVLSVGAAILPGATGGAIESGWREFTPSGIPVTAAVGAVAVGTGGFVAVGNDLGRGGEWSDFVVWHSADGEAWNEMYRSNGNSADDADVVSTGGGFAVISTTCIVPNGQGPAEERCDPQAVVSPDGRRWQRADFDLDGGDWPRRNARVSKMAGTEGRLIAGGWIERGPGGRDSAVWHSEDGGKTWAPSANPVPANPEKPDEITAVSQVPDGWLASGYDELERRGGPSFFTVRREPRMWRSPDGLVWERLEPPKGASSVHLLTTARSVSYVAGGSPGGVSVWRTGPNGAWVDTDDGFEAVPNSMSVLEGNADGLVVGGWADRNRAVLWGSADGFNYRRTLTAPDGTWFTAAVRHKDRWYVYGSTRTAVISTVRGWVASVDCATGQTCSDVRSGPHAAGS